MLISENLHKLLSVLADSRFHSGTALAQLLGISRSAIWKQLQALTEFGLEVNAVSGKGYRLEQPLQLLDQQAIEAHLTPAARSVLQQIEIHDVIGSTNTYLLDIAQKNQVSGRVCLAEYQTAGKGRRGRTWVSPFGHNIYLSILWCYQDGPAAIAGLSLAVGVAVVRALQQMGVKDVGLKWPNDIYWQGRKLAGILIEVSGESSGPCHAVIGLGMNLYLPKQAAEVIEQAWVDLQQILGGQVMLYRNQWVAALLNQMLPVIADFENQSLPKYLQEWRSFDCMLGKQVTIFIGRQGFEGEVKGIDDQGLLLLRDEAGDVRAFASGEVSFRAV